MNIRQDSGFSMTELMVVVLISTVALAGIYSTFLVGNKTWSHYNNTVAVKKEVRRALINMVNDLREGENIRIIQNTNGSAIHFHKPSSGDISYTWEREGDQASRIIKRSNKGPRIIAHHVSTLNFKKMKNTLFINIAATKDEQNTNMIQVALREKIALRPKTVLYTP